jgi:PKD repeat protein
MMKSYVIALGLLAMLICSTLPVTASTSGPDVRLPTDYVTMRAVYGTESWFDMTLLNISEGYDVTNGPYLGWCVEKDTNMTRRVNHTVLLYSSYDPAMPWPFHSDNWDKVNYVINYNHGGRESIQRVIWYYICNDPFPTNDTDAQAMIADANISGPGFIPSFNQKIAILVDVINGIYSIQRTFFELTLPSPVALGDLVWNDYDADGIQDAGEPGIPGLTVQLFNATNAMVGNTTTDTHGYYSFSDFLSGLYSIQFVLPQHYRFSPQHQGTDVTMDSDANRSTGRTPQRPFFSPTPDNMSVDAGMYMVEEPTPPGEPGTPVLRGEVNHPPTADGTAGEPYTAFIGEELHFNGSRSYDRDGTIVSWRWSFGDGITANGTTVSHLYTEAGVYTVLLTVTDNDGATDTYETVARVKLPNRPPLQPTLTGPLEGNRNISYIFSAVTTDPDEDDVRYMILWGDSSQNTSPFFRSGHSIQTLHQWAAWGFYTVQVYAQDPSNVTSGVYEIVVAIDVRYVGSLGYLINTDSIGQFDVFYSNLTRNQTSVQRQPTGVYLIDTNGDGKYDYQYDPSSSSFREYPETLGPEYTMLLVGLGAVIVLLVLLGFLVKRKRTKPKQ